MTADTALSPAPDPTGRDRGPLHPPAARMDDVPKRLRPGLRAPSSPLFPTIDSCPGCRGELRCTTLQDAVVFGCGGCGALWRFELGYASRLRPPRRLPGSDE